VVEGEAKGQGNRLLHEVVDTDGVGVGSCLGPVYWAKEGSCLEEQVLLGDRGAEGYEEGVLGSVVLLFGLWGRGWCNWWWSGNGWGHGVGGGCREPHQLELSGEELYALLVE
jgi:hypothetical protein